MITELLICDAITRSGLELFTVFTVPMAIETGLPAAPCLAVMEVEPAATAVAKPELELMVATEASEEAQATDEVTFSVLPSLKVPMAVNWSEVPAAIERLDGLTAMDFKVAEVTVRGTAGLVTAPMAAVIWEVPGAIPRTKPAPALAIPVLVEFQAALVVTFCFVPSLNVPVARSCTVPLRATDAVVGATEIERRVAEVTFRVAVELAILPNVAVISVVPVA
jgi:hypothetical protein